ncbi:hypothetical protein BJ508DRAFT_111380 [Ascobolus immersus RN42]|uniref:Azaphilone pigments biosynthesis cluster protein L N-terminal domain-containing protein n=1 Tax=Ascobolus immersus RN42 TaxID=1160509 RepID=A0A3N4I698_ASCIM|nr:hypothetical protein BJ508DRAFT_111380 [Ascobolus immersus RN42]
MSMLPTTLGAVVALLRLLEDIKSAPTIIRDLETEVMQLRSILEELERCKRFASPTTDTLILENEKHLDDVIDGCWSIICEVTVLATKFNSKKGGLFSRPLGRVAWAMDGQRKVERYRKRLAEIKATLNIAVGLRIRISVDSVQDDTRHILAQIETLLNQLSIEDLESALAQTGSESSYMLRRYLESASGYAESILKGGSGATIKTTAIGAETPSTGFTFTPSRLSSIREVPPPVPLPELTTDNLKLLTKELYVPVQKKKKRIHRRSWLALGRLKSINTMASARESQIESAEDEAELDDILVIIRELLYLDEADWFYIESCVAVVLFSLFVLVMARYRPEWDYSGYLTFLRQYLSWRSSEPGSSHAV